MMPHLIRALTLAIAYGYMHFITHTHTLTHKHTNEHMGTHAPLTPYAHTHTTNTCITGDGLEEKGKMGMTRQYSEDGFSGWT